MADEERTEEQEQEEQDSGNGGDSGDGGGGGSEGQSDAMEAAEKAKEEQEEAKEKMKELEEDPPDNLEDWPDDKTKYETFGGAEGNESYDDSVTAKLGPSSLRHRDDGSVEIEGEEVDEPEEYKGDPIPGGPTDPQAADSRAYGEPDLTDESSQDIEGKDDDGDGDGDGDGEEAEEKSSSDDGDDDGDDKDGEESS